MNWGLAAIAFAILAGFLGILVWHVPSPDLIAVTGIVVALAGFDFVRTLISGKR